MAHSRATPTAPEPAAPSDRPTIDRWLCLLVALGILWLLTYPFNFAGRALTPWLAETEIKRLNGMANVVLFVPWGGVIAVTLWRRGWRRELAVAAAVIGGTNLSLLGETLQVFLPGRVSSWIDIANNGAGSLVGAIGGWRAAATISDRSAHFAAWARHRPRARRALWAAAVVLILRTAPFDFAAESGELRMGWGRARAEAMAQWRAIETLAHGHLPRVPWWAALDAALFTVAAVWLGRAFRESLERTGDRSSPMVFIVVVGATAATVTEIMQCPIQSRVMDPADGLGCVVGVILGAAIDQAKGRLWQHGHGSDDSRWTGRGKGG